MSRSNGRLDRRTFLRGAGVACALPYLEAMGASAALSAGERRKRMCFVYFPNGVSLPAESDPAHEDWSWFPIGSGKDYRLTRVLEPLAPYRDQMTVLGGLSYPKSRRLLGHLAGDTWLTGGDLRGSEYRNRISVDQVAANHLSESARYRSLVFSTDGGVGYKSRVATLSFAEGGRPIPAEHRQRAIFERYFAATPGGTAERRKSLAARRRVVDLVLEDARDLQRNVGVADQQRVEEYLGSLYSVEEQINRNESWLDTPLVTPDGATPNLVSTAAVDPEGYLRAMFDLIVLAFQTDLTRVATFMMAREDGMGLGDLFPKFAIGVDKGHHTISHDNVDGHFAEWGGYDRWLTEQFAYFVKRMSTVEDDQGPLLDSSIVLYGSACSTTHNATNYPLVLAGGGDLGLRHGRYVRQEHETPLSNLFVTLLNAAGVPTDRFADSTGALQGLMV